MRSILLAALTGCLFASSALAAPPPWPPEAVTQIAPKITASYNARDLEAYGTLFDDGVKVYNSQQTVATNKAQWLALVQTAFSSRIQTAQPINIAAGHNRIIIFEMFRDNPRSPSTMQAIAVPRVAAYTVTNGKITEVQFVEGASYLIGEDKSR